MKGANLRGEKKPNKPFTKLSLTHLNTHYSFDLMTRQGGWLSHASWHRWGSSNQPPGLIEVCQGDVPFSSQWVFSLKSCKGFGHCKNCFLTLPWFMHPSLCFLNTSIAFRSNIQNPSVRMQTATLCKITTSDSDKWWIMLLLDANLSGAQANSIKPLTITEIARTTWGSFTYPTPSCDFTKVQEGSAKNIVDCSVRSMVQVRPNWWKSWPNRSFCRRGFAFPAQVSVLLRMKTQLPFTTKWQNRLPLITMKYYLFFFFFSFCRAFAATLVSKANRYYTVCL